MGSSPLCLQDVSWVKTPLVDWAVLYYKALAEDKFKWPKGHEDTLTLTGQQLNWLLDGLDIDAMKGYKKLHYESVF